MDCLHSSQRTPDLPPTSLSQILHGLPTFIPKDRGPPTHIPMPDNLWIAYIHAKGQQTSHPHPYARYSMDCLHSCQSTADLPPTSLCQILSGLPTFMPNDLGPPTHIPMPDTPWIAYIHAKGLQTSHPHPCARYSVDCLHSSQRTVDLPPTSLCQIICRLPTFMPKDSRPPTHIPMPDTQWIAYIHAKGLRTSHPHPYARYALWIAYIHAKGPWTSHPHPCAR